MQKSVLITGCSEGGIGHELALQFHGHGLKVIATGRSVESMKTLKTQGIDTLKLDVTSPSDIRSVKAQVEKITGGTLDVLVNNAGVAYESAVSDDNMERVRSIFDTNFFGIVETVQAFLPLLIAANKGQYASSAHSISWASRIILVSSITAIMPMPFHAAYNATKAALLQYGNTLRIEMEPFGVKVITIHTGRVVSRLVKETDRHSLPEGSIYGPVRDVYEGFGHDVLALDPTPSAEFAKNTVAHILKKDAGAFFWYGGQTWVTWMMDNFFPRTMWDRVFKGMFQFARMGAAFREESIKSGSP